MTKLDDIYAALSAAPNHFAAHAIMIGAEGWQCLGKGCFASVYGHDDVDTVIKVCGSLNDGSLPFVALALEGHKENPHFPRIFRAGVGGSWYWCAMERLAPITPRSAPMSREIRQRLDAERAYAQRILWNRYGMKHSLAEAIAGVPPALRELCDTVHEQIAGRYEIDLHNENAMARLEPCGRWTLVVTDPFSFIATGQSPILPANIPSHA